MLSQDRGGVGKCAGIWRIIYHRDWGLGCQSSVSINLAAEEADHPKVVALREKDAEF